MTTMEEVQEPTFVSRENKDARVPLSYFFLLFGDIDSVALKMEKNQAAWLVAKIKECTNRYKTFRTPFDVI